jgi:hypothetical protein
MSPIAGRFLGRDPIGFEGSPFDLYEFVEGRVLVSTDPKGLCGGRSNGSGYIFCGGAWIQTFTSGCCNDKPFLKRAQCCENGQIVSKVPIWKTTFLVFQNTYLNNVACGWNIACPFSWFGWTPSTLSYVLIVQLLVALELTM